MSRKKGTTKTYLNKQLRAYNDRKNPKNRAEFKDFDYLNELSPEDLEWHRRFTEEYYNATMDTENPENNLHKTKEEKKIAWGINNRRNRDSYAYSQATNKLILADGVEVDVVRPGSDPVEQTVKKEEEAEEIVFKSLCKKALTGPRKKKTPPTS